MIWFKFVNVCQTKLYPVWYLHIFSAAVAIEIQENNRSSNLDVILVVKDISVPKYLCRWSFSFVTKLPLLFKCFLTEFKYSINVEYSRATSWMSRRKKISYNKAPKLYVLNTACLCNFRSSSKSRWISIMFHNLMHKICNFAIITNVSVKRFL